MKEPKHVLDIFLQPGDFYFGDSKTRIRTLLGSCVAITMWHPRLHIGGMCHFMLPERTTRASDVLDGRYANEAMLMFEKAILKAGTKPAEYQVKLFGGGNMFKQPARQEGCVDVPCRNVEAARKLLSQYGHNVVAEHVGMHGHRNVILELWSGDVWLKHVNLVTDPGGIEDATD